LPEPDRKLFEREQAAGRGFWAYTHTDENSDRVGEFAIGPTWCRAVIGNILQDEKFPGSTLRLGTLMGTHRCTMAFGTHIDVWPGFNIWLESETGQEQIMREGRF